MLEGVGRKQRKALVGENNLLLQCPLTEAVALFVSLTICLSIYRKDEEEMHLMYYLDENKQRVYTLKKETPDGEPSISAHPARFSPDDKFSKERITCKKRFGLLPTQLPGKEY